MHISQTRTIIFRIHELMSLFYSIQRDMTPLLVSLAAVFSIVTQRSSQGALRDDTKNGSEGDYPFID